MDNPISGIAPAALEHVIAHLRAEYPGDAAVLDRLLAHLKQCAADDGRNQGGRLRFPA